jgi:hypothetical protein
LAFFAMFCYPPLHVGSECASDPHIAGGCRLARSPDIVARRFDALPFSAMSR